MDYTHIIKSVSFGATGPGAAGIVEVEKELVYRDLRDRLGVEVYTALASWSLGYNGGDRPWAQGGIDTTGSFDPDTGVVKLRITGTINDGSFDDGIVMSGVVTVFVAVPEDA